VPDDDDDAYDLSDWSRPHNRKPQDGFVILTGTANHKSCMDCEHARVADFPNRACFKHPGYHLWFQGAATELQEEWTSTVDHRANTRVEHPGQTMADACPDYELASEFVGLPFKYVEDYDRELGVK
jgi:hypothetical protein